MGGSRAFNAVIEGYLGVVDAGARETGLGPMGPMVCESQTKGYIYIYMQGKYCI